MRADLHIVDALRGTSDIDLATWRAAFDAIGIEVTFPDGFELPAPESAHSVTVRFRVTDARAWRLGDAIVAAEHVIELRRGRCELCSPPENKDRRRNLDAGWRERIGEAIATLRGS